MYEVAIMTAAGARICSVFSGTKKQCQSYLKANPGIVPAQDRRHNEAQVIPVKEPVAVNHNGIRRARGRLDYLIYGV